MIPPCRVTANNEEATTPDAAPEIITVYITKYALSVGILVGRAEHNPGALGGMVIYRPPHGVLQFFHHEGHDWHRTLDGAIVRADAMRAAKIVSLGRQIKKIERMTVWPIKDLGAG